MSLFSTVGPASVSAGARAGLATWRSRIAGAGRRPLAKVAPSWKDTKGPPRSSRHIQEPTQTIILAITGASGSALAIEALRALEADARVARIHLIASPSALRVLAEESGIAGRNELVERLLGRASAKVTLHAHEDVGAPIASGSYPVHAMLVLPCSMGTLAGIAHGIASNLIERAADVCLKERRRLVLCVRETPLSLIHLRNMAAATEAGATIFPVVPAFYARPQTIEDVVHTYVQRVLAHTGLPQAGAFTWGESDA